MDRDDVARHQVVRQFYDHVNAHCPLWDFKLKRLGFGFEGLQAGVADIACLAVGTENHLFIAVTRCLWHVDSGVFEYRFTIKGFGGHIQDHSVV